MSSVSNTPSTGKTRNGLCVTHKRKEWYRYIQYTATGEQVNHHSIIIFRFGEPSTLLLLTLPASSTCTHTVLTLIPCGFFSCRQSPLSLNILYKYCTCTLERTPSTSHITISPSSTNLQRTPSITYHLEVVLVI